MSNEELILAELRKINERLGGMDKRFDGIDNRLDGVDKRLDGMDKRLDSMEEKLDDLLEEHKITREAVNRLIDWTEQAGYIIKYPFAQ